MRLIFLGPPGVGKGTQAKKLSSEKAITKISTGDILREAVSRRTALGLEAKSYMDQGRLVPDEVVIGLIRDRLKDGDCQGGYVLDGFPRTLPQAQALEKLLKEQQTPIQGVISFEVSEGELVRRLTGRRSCPKCQKIYHLEFYPPSEAGQCDECGSELVQREDDKAVTVRNRLKVYAMETAPLLKYYKDQNLLHPIGGEDSVDAVYERLLDALGQIEAREGTRK